MRLWTAILLCLFPISPAFAAELPTTDTPVGRLALHIVPDSMVVSPDSSRVVFAAQAGNPTLEDKGIFLNPQGTDPRNDSARPVLNPICLYIDDRSTIDFVTVTPPVFSPNSKRLGYAGLYGKTWQLVLDNKTLIQDADDVPANPIIFSADSAHVAWVIQKGQQYFLTVDDRRWPPIDAGVMSMLTFSPDSRHVAAVMHARGAWTLYVDGLPLPTPPSPVATGRTSASRPASPAPGGPQPAALTPRLDRFGQYAWRPDSKGLAFYAAFTGASWQLYSQSLDGAITFASKPFDGSMKNAPVFSPDAQQLAFAATTRAKWSVITDATKSQLPTTEPASAPSAPTGLFDQLLLESMAYYQPANAPNQPYTLLYLAQQNKKWRLYIHERPAADAFDTIIQGTFILSPDKHHYAFAGTRDGQTYIIKDGTALAHYDECGGFTLAFSPDSQHLAYAARNGLNWFACVDGVAGTPFIIMTGSPIAFSPDSSRVAYVALTASKSWRLIVGKDGGLQSKSYDAFLKGSHVNWRPDGTVVTIAIQKTVATRIEARP